MKFKQYYLECLSHASYLIGDEATGRAVIVDPQRDVSEYLADAAAAGMQIELVIETHFHADFLSGHLELAAATGAAIAYSSVANTEFESVGVEDGQRYQLGEVELEFRHTPGHTPESISIVVWESAGDVEPWGVLTGDTLFIGDVGRPDLLSSIGFDRNELASSLYDSLHHKLMTLPDDTRLFPAHGAGSSCGKNLSADLECTIGKQRLTNYALLAPDRTSFVDLVTAGQSPAPTYFAHDAMLNRKDRGLLDESAMPVPLTIELVQNHLAAGAVLLDVREPEEFASGHIRGSVNVGLSGRYAELAGSVIDPESDIVLVVGKGNEVDARNRLARIGYDNVIGYIADYQNVMYEHPESTTNAPRLTAAQLREQIAEDENLQVVDVRNPGEVEAGCLVHSLSIPLPQLRSRLNELDPGMPVVVYCAGGFRSSVAASLLRTNGFDDVSDLVGGYAAWVNA